MKKLRKYLLATCLSVSLAACLVGCIDMGDGSSSESGLQSQESSSSSSVIVELTLNKTALELEVGASETLTVNAEGVRWTSDNDSIAVVVDGTVTAIAVGTATITATKGEQTVSCRVTVSETSGGLEAYPVLVFSVKAEKIIKGYSFNAEAFVSVDNVLEEACVVEFSGDNAEVVTVTSEGLITAVGAGVANVTASAVYNGINLSETIEITVVDGIPSVSFENISDGKLSLVENKSFTVNAKLDKITYQDGALVATPLDSSLIEWESENESIVSVENGVITANVIGSTTVYARYNGENISSISVMVLRNVFTFENDLSRVSAGNNIGDFSLGYYSETAYTPTANQGEKALKISNLGNVTASFTVDFGRKLHKGTVIAFDVLVDYDGAFTEQDGWFWLLFGGRDLFDANAFSDFTYVIWSVGQKSFCIELTSDVDDGVISLGFNVGRSVNDYSKFVFYVDNIGIASAYTVKTYMQNDTDYTENVSVVNSFVGADIDYTMLAEENCPAGYVLNKQKSVLTGENDGELILEVYYDKLSAKTELDAEGTNDIRYISQNANCGTFDFSIVTYSEEGIVAPENGGTKGIKVTNSSTGYPVIDIALGTTFKAGSILSFDFACVDDNKTGGDGHFGLIVNGTWYSLDNTACYHWNTSGTWAHYEVKLTSDTDVISLGANGDSGFVGTSNKTALKFYFDNIKVLEPLEAKTELNAEGTNDIRYISQNANCGTFDFSIVTYSEEGIAAPENGGTKGIKVTNSSTGYPVIDIALGTTFKVGSILSFDFACVDDNKTGGDGHFGLIVNGTWYSLDNTACYHWNTSGTWAHYEVKLTSDTDVISLGANGDSGFVGTSNKTALKFYFDNIKIREPKTIIDFEADNDIDYVKVNNHVGSVGIVDSDIVAENTESDLGDKMVKIHANGSDPAITIHFGKELSAGTVISWDMYVVNTNTAESGWFALVINGENQGMNNAYWANGDAWNAYWKHAEYTLTAAGDSITITLPLAGLVDHTISDYTTITAYFDNFKVNEN